MRPIDADALNKQYKTKIGEWRGNGILPSMECLMWIAAENMLVDAPTIDVIPVRWLIDRANDPERAPLYRRYAQMLIEEWKKEQEEK